ncbi:uncharacterized protein [Blastocystis hominis]|uniref:AMP-dependent synthetase/ligase domain-containing protein n=1 Tax=Blastocystis hominis TaxID=12968 RepID=D8MBN1_BLAHO|nr:uncharacterized protein [Blastocystis hominis]CBK25470.2 unnamed protein product [Blastocystis hominis]|eukprot:XP_012899518.1 uncharacterized protein [Blastocystis hominis]
MMASRNVRLASTVVGSTFEAVKVLPYKNAIKFANENIHFNYKTMMNNVRMLANGFYELGMKPGDSVMAWTDSRSETLTAFYACSMTGLRLVTVDPKIKDADVFVDVLREADPTLLLYSPSSTQGEREGVLKSLVPELDSVRLATMVEPLKSRQFRHLRAVASTEWDHSSLNGVTNFRTLLVDQVFPDLVAEVSKRLEAEPETVLLRSYAYSDGRVLKSKDLTQKQVNDAATRIAKKLQLTADSILCLDLPMYLPISLMSAVACLQKNAMFVVPKASCVQVVRETLEKENASHVLTSKTHCPLLQEQPAKTLKMGLYPTECCVCKPTTGLETVKF